MKHFLWISFWLGSTLSALATDYYLSVNGNDSNTGTSSASPWQTIDKLNSQLGGTSGTWGNFNPGDRVFFRRGDTFRGQINVMAYNITGVTFDAYGTGAMPIIRGSVLATGWTVHSGNIWKTTLTGNVQYLFANAQAQTLARWPNIGIANLTASTTTSITSSSIGSSGLNFVGANICLRDFEWRMNRQVVTGQSGNVVSWATNINAAETGANFYFDNKLALLDSPNEWFYDRSSQTLYYMPPTGQNPNNMTIEASVYQFGLGGNDNRTSITVQNLAFEQFWDTALQLKGASDNAIIQNCRFDGNSNAILVSGSTEQVLNNTITNSFVNGIVVANFTNSTMSGNSVTNTAVTFGQQPATFSGDFITNAINVINGRVGAVVSNNVVDRAGYNGIKFGGTGVTIERNQVKNTLLNMSDGGAIYAYGAESNNCIIRNNIVDGVTGDKYGSPTNAIAIGIYIDNYANTNQITGNTLMNIANGSGITINAGVYNCSLTNNTAYKCKQGIVFADWMAGKSIYGNTVTGNVLYANVSGGVPIQIASDDNNYDVLTSSNSNYLCNPFGTAVVNYIWSTTSSFTLPQWRTVTGLDAASKDSYFSWTAPTDNSFIVSNPTVSPIIKTYTNVLDLNTTSVTSVTLSPFSSRVLINNVTAPASPTASVTQQPTCTTATGTIVVSAPTGTDLQYSRNNGTTYQNSTTFSGLTPGVYPIRVRNTLTGLASTSISLTVSAVPTPPAIPTASVTRQPACTNATGTIVITAPTGSSLQYSNNNGSTYQASTTFANLTPGVYTILAKNTATGCTSGVTNLTINAVPVCNELMIYDESLATGWSLMDWSWGGPTDINSMEQKYAGSIAAKTTITGDWGAFAVARTAAISLSPYPSGLSFWFYAQKAGNYRCSVYQTNTTNESPAYTFTIPTANVWTRVNVSWAQVGNPTTLFQVRIGDNGSPASTGSFASPAKSYTFFVDQLRLLSVSSARLAIQTPNAETIDKAESMVYPNPATNHLFIEFGVQRTQPVTLRLTDLTGSVIQSLEVVAEAGWNKVSMPVRPMAGTIHLLQIQKDERVEVKKVFFER